MYKVSKDKLAKIVNKIAGEAYIKAVTNPDFVVFGAGGRHADGFFIPHKYKNVKSEKDK